jgi:multidrug efflux pump subunit AcrB
VFQADAKVSAGEIHNSRMRMAVEVEGALDTLERIRQIPLRQTAEGSAVLVGDLAEVSRRTKTPASDVAIIDGQQAVVVGIRMLPDQRSDRWSAEVGAALAEFQQQLPANVVIKTIFDQEHYTSARLNQLTNNIVLGFGLIAVVLLFTLGWRAALMVAAALPLMVLFTFACMNFTGLPIHQMSVTGLIVALGIMVDNAIVMVDTVNRFKQQGIAGLRATQAALNHLWMPLLGSTVTTMLAFMPIIVMPGGAGEFTGAISLTVVFSLLGSYLISHCVVAGFAGRFLVVDRRSGWWHNGVQLPQWSSRFRQTIDWAISHPRQLIAGVTLLPLLGFILGSMLPEQFFPPADRDMINLEVFLPAAVGIEQTINLTEKISEVIKAEQSVKSLHWFIGNNAPAYYYNLGQGRDDSQYYAQAMLTVDHFSDADYLVPTLQRQLDDQFPEAQIIIRRLEQGPPFGAPVEIRIVGAELETLKELGNTLRRRALAIEDVVHARATLSEAVPKIWLAVNENQARAGNLSLTDIAGQLQQSVDGAIAGSVLEGTQSLPVRVQAKGQKQLDAGAVHSWLLLPGASESSAEPIPYAALGDISIRPQQGVIPRRDGERINTIQLYIRDGVLPAVVLHRLQQSLAETPQDLPLGYRLEFAGEDEKRAETVNKLVSSMGIIVLLLIVSVVMSFNSFRLSAIVFIVAIQSAGLGMLALSFSGQPFGFTAIIGLMGLIGLAINAAIVILAELKSDCEAVAGNKTAVINGVMNCSRHIVSTTTTTVVGFIPLILSGGAFWPPFAFVIAGGTFLATLLSFYFVPVMFCAMTRRRNFELTGLPQALIG